jgi:catechol 2,3-dioxygenase-like lactoylglutathione lyase family enzyme
MIKRIAHLCLVSNDLAATERFYTEALGLKKAFYFLRNGVVIGFYLAVGDDNFIEVFHTDHVPNGESSAIQHFCLEVDSIDEISARVKSAGYEITSKQFGCDRSWQAWLTDPNGVKIELHEYTPESSQVTRTDVHR